ncbi:NAD(P)-dependent oxidoreductase [Candidatus Woesearchaeota archaeon]|nr:NAD(P)-dependent oxidoreductase [Candidatus Woesearchaeota archaeon]
MVIQNVGFAGIGTMGSGMSRNLVKAGFNVFVYNRTRPKAEAIQGATVVDTPAELCGKAEVVLMCVSNDASLRDILYSSSGIMSSLSRKNILIDSSTTSVELTAEMAGKCAEKGAEFLDAPVTGGMKGAAEGTLLYMIGGKKEVFEKCRNVLEAMGKRLIYCGPNTYGQRMKIALNLTQAMVLESYLEGVVLGLKEGLPIDVIIEAFDNSGAKSGVATAKMPSILQRDFSPTFLLELMNKDHKLADSEIKKLKLTLPIAAATVKILQEGMDKGLAKEDWIAIAKLLEQKNNVKISKQQA